MIESNPPPANRTPLEYASGETSVSRSATMASLALASAVSFFVVAAAMCLGFGEGRAFLLTLLLPPIGLALGIAARRNSRAASPRGLALAAIFISGLELALILGGTMLLPTMGRRVSRQTESKCASNLRQIGMALQIYANEHNGQFPPSFDEVLMYGDITSEVFVCPSSNDTHATGPTTQATIQQWRKPGFLSYVYVPPSPGITVYNIHPGYVLAYEPTSQHGGDGMNVLYGDAHVDFVSKKEADRIAAELQAGFNPPRPPAGARSPTTQPSSMPTNRAAATPVG